MSPMIKLLLISSIVITLITKSDSQEHCGIFRICGEGECCVRSQLFRLPLRCRAQSEGCVETLLFENEQVNVANEVSAHTGYYKDPATQANEILEPSPNEEPVTPEYVESATLAIDDSQNMVTEGLANNADEDSTILVENAETITNDGSQALANDDSETTTDDDTQALADVDLETTTNDETETLADDGSETITNDDTELENDESATTAGNDSEANDE